MNHPEANLERPSPPSLSADQMRAARQKATASRRHRAEVKAELKSGETSLAEVLNLARDDDVVAHIKVIDLLRSMPRVGETKAERLMERLGIAETRRIRGLGARQAAQLLDHFGGRP